MRALLWALSSLCLNRNEQANYSLLVRVPHENLAEGAGRYSSPCLVVVPRAAEATVDKRNHSPVFAHDRIQGVNHAGAVQHLNQLRHSCPGAVPAFASWSSEQASLRKGGHNSIARCKAAGTFEIVPDCAVDLGRQAVLSRSDNGHSCHDQHEDTQSQVLTTSTHWEQNLSTAMRECDFHLDSPRVMNSNMCCLCVASSCSVSAVVSTPSFAVAHGAGAGRSPSRKPLCK